MYLAQEIEFGLLPIVVFATIICFLLTWSIGANDVANTFGTSVGAKVLTVRQACVIAAIFEFLGAFLMGSHVADTFRDKILHSELWSDQPWELAVGMAAAMIGAFFLITLATFFSLPVSGTHAILGAVIGFAVLSRGVASVQWMETLFIIAGWLLSPVLAGITASVMFWLLRRFIMRSDVSFRKALRFLPFCYGLTVCAVVLFVLWGPLVPLPFWGVLLIAVVVGLVLGVVVWLSTPLLEHYASTKAGYEHELVLPSRIRELPCPPFNSTSKEITRTGAGEVELEELEDADEPAPLPVKELQAGKGLDAIEVEVEEPPAPSGIVVAFSTDEDTGATKSSEESEEPSESEGELEVAKRQDEVFDGRTEELFSMGQVLMAIVGSFAHGANDIANAIGPFAVVVSVYQTQSVQSTGGIPWWILLLGSCGIVLGLATWGYRVIRTIGERLTKVTPSRGFNIELGSAVTVMTASRIGIPLSTTHCKVGAVVGVGLCDGENAVQWRMVLNIALGWIVTLPVAGVVSGIVYLFLIGLGDFSF